MAKQPIIKIDDIKDIADIMTKSEIAGVEQNFVKQALKAKKEQGTKVEATKPATLVVEEIEVNDRSINKDIDRDKER